MYIKKYINLKSTQMKILEILDNYRVWAIITFFAAALLYLKYLEKAMPYKILLVIALSLLMFSIYTWIRISRRFSSGD